MASMQDDIPSYDPRKPARIPSLGLPFRPIEQRRADFVDVFAERTPEWAIHEASRCMQCSGSALCRSACPAGNDIPQAMQLIAQGKFIEAAQIYRKTSSLPEVCGRICPHEKLCQGGCQRASPKTRAGRPVLTGALEAFVTEFQRQEQGVTIPVAASTGRKVAVIGAGPAGLSCAEQLVRRGHWVTVYDAMPLPGGMMISTIPNFRLPKQLIQGIWGDLERAGVTFIGNTYIGRKKTVDDLIREGYEAVFIGIGAGLQARLGLPGEDLAEVFQVNQFLMRVNAPLEFLPEGERQRPTIGRRVVVIGGGDPATDCARSAIRLGAEEVVCLFNQTEKELPGRLEDRQLASEEGVTFHLQVQPVRFIAGETGKLAQIECVRTRPGPPDQPGAPSIRAVRRSNFFIEADTAIVAAGYSPDPIIAATTPGLKAHKWGLIIADQETGATSRFGIFTGGDVVTGPDLVVTAMVAGRKAANNIDAYLG